MNYSDFLCQQGGLEVTCSSWSCHVYQSRGHACAAQSCEHVPPLAGAAAAPLRRCARGNPSGEDRSARSPAEGGSDAWPTSF